MPPSARSDLHSDSGAVAGVLQRCCLSGSAGDLLRLLFFDFLLSLSHKRSALCCSLLAVAGSAGWLLVLLFSWLLCCFGFIDNLDGRRGLWCFHFPVLDREDPLQCVIQELVLFLSETKADL